MESKTIDEMTEEEFDYLLDDIAEATFDQVTHEAFVEAIDALEMYQRPRVIELSGTYADGNVLFDILHGTAEILNGTGP